MSELKEKSGLDRLGPWMIVIVILAGLINLLANYAVPLVNFGVLHTVVGWNLLDKTVMTAMEARHFDFGVGVGFAWLSLPLIKYLPAWGALKVSTFFYTSVYAGVCYLFFKKVNVNMGVSTRWIWLEMLLVFCNPLMIYQFISAYPDILTGTFFLVALLLADKLTEKPDQFSSIWAQLITLFVFAAWINPVAVLMVPLTLIYLGFGTAFKHQILSNDKRLLTLLGGLIVYLFVLLLIYKFPSLYATFRFTVYSKMPSLAVNFRMLVFALFFIFMSFGFLLLRIKSDAKTKPFIALTIAYAVLFLFESGTDDKLRYFIPLFPIVSLLIAKMVSEWEDKKWFVWHLSSFLLIQIVLILAFNSQSVIERFKIHDHFSKFLVSDLRLPENQMVEQAVLKFIRERAKPSDVLAIKGYFRFPDFGYYYHRAGLIEKDIEIVDLVPGQKDPVDIDHMIYMHWSTKNLTRVQMIETLASNWKEVYEEVPRLYQALFFNL